MVGDVWYVFKENEELESKVSEKYKEQMKMERLKCQLRVESSELSIREGNNIYREVLEILCNL